MIKLNATGRYTILNIAPEESPVYEKVSNNGIMDPIEFSKSELAELWGYVDLVDSTDTSWANTRMRVKSEYQERLTN